MLKHKKIKVQLNNNRIQENSFLKGGEVMYKSTTPFPEHNIKPDSLQTPISQKVQELLNSLNA